MRCRHLKRALLEHRLGLRPGVPDGALGTHLDTCEACATEVRAEDRLAIELSSLREAAPVEVDVVDRVLSQIAAIGPVDREDVPLRQVGGAVLAAAVVGAVILGTAVRQAPGWYERLGETRTLVGGLAVALAGLVQPVRHLLDVAREVMGFAWKPMLVLGSYLDRTTPIAQGLLLLVVLAMTATTLVVAGRDLRRQHGLVSKER